MSVDVTAEQKELSRWLVHEIGAGRLAREFNMLWVYREKGTLSRTNFTGASHPLITKPALDALEQAGLLMGTPYSKRIISTATKYRKPKYRQRETHRRCVLNMNTYEAVLLDPTKVVTTDE